MDRKQLFKQMPWSWKELIVLLVLVLIVVPFFIEYLLQTNLTDLFQNDFYSGTLTGFIMSIIFLVGLYMVTLRPKKLSWKEVGLLRFSKSYWSPTILWAVVLVISSIVLAIIIDLLFGIGTDNQKTESIQTRLSTINIIIAFVSAAIISPVYEEIFYRGFLYRWFRVKFGLVTGLLVSSFIFTLVHIPTYNSLPYNFLSGLIFAWTYEKTSSVYPAIIIHGIFNGLSVILTVIM